ncbi:MAG: SpoIIE family protein phosphatase [Candidatus Acidiferrales bacterium]|jgi:sigma-B regulation protein RsbU (phosphoserine phosphatase)
MSQFSPRRLWVLFRRTSPLDRVAILMLALYGLSRLGRNVTGYSVPFAPFLGFLSVAAVGYLVVRLILLVRRRGLWRLRNRLIVAYIFMAVVPVVLILTGGLIAAMLLELQIGAHLLRDDLHDRTTVIAADADAIAAALNREPDLKVDQPVSPESTAVEDPILSRPEVAKIIAGARAEWPELRVYINHGQQLVRSGNGRQFAGLAEFRGQLWFASAETLSAPGGRATLLAIAPITPALLDKLPSNLGPIQLSLLEPAGASPGKGIFFEIDGTRYVLGERIASAERKVPPPANWLDRRIDGLATLEAVRADLGPDAVNRPVLAQFSLRFSAINRDLLISMGAWGPILVEALIVVVSIFLVLEIAALVTGIVLTRTITRSVADLYEGTLHVRRGDFSHRIRVHQQDQLGALGESFNEMTSSISELIEEQRQKQRLENEVSIAREVQQQLFPSSLPSLPGLELAAICRPARVVSGDYYDFIPLGPSRVGIALADISGKGIFAALLMASLQAALRSAAMMEGLGSTAEVVSRVNRQLFVSTSDDRYATLLYAVYDSETKTLTYTNAGHLAPFLVLDGTVRRLDQGGTVVGLFEDARYAAETLQIAPGSLLVAFSDGLTEPENVYGEEFGIERLKAEVLRQRNAPVRRLAENLISAADQWAGAPEQADDATIIVARMG